MPSPFPGMDPYLERPAFRSGLHGTLIGVIRELLNPLVRPRFWVDIQERLYVEQEDLPPRVILPDLVMSEDRTKTAQPASVGLLAPEFVEVQETVEVPVKESYLVIREMPGREVVTVIEVLSPTNKSTSGNGVSEYLRKRAEVLSSATSLVEIDLLRAGRRPPYVGKIPPHDYLVLVHRGWERPRVWARGWTLRDPIPQVPVPLRSEDSSVLLDLSQALRLVYDRGAYDLVVNYAGPADPPLDAEEQSWAHEIAARR